MEEKRKKFLPQDAIPIPKKNAQKTGKSSFRTRIISENHQDISANKGISFKDQFDIYVTENYNITDECKKNLWHKIGEQMLHNEINNLGTLIDIYLKSNNINKFDINNLN